MKRKIAWSVGAAVAVAGAVALSVPLIDTVAPDESNASEPVAVLVATAAEKYVAEQPERVFSSPREQRWQRGIVRQDNLSYVAYERTYQGLPVRGGDFVVVANEKGKVLSSSSAQTQILSLADLTPSLTADQAIGVAKRSLAKVETTSRAVLTVVANGNGTLTYEVVVDGYKSNTTTPSKLHVFVNAETGEVLADQTYDDVRAATGNGHHNGTVNIDVNGTTMSDPTRSGLRCGGQNGTTYTSSTGTWGNGGGTDLVTGCVDAMYAVQKQWDMLSAWLGRNGINGSGGGFPARVGLNDVNAFWNGSYTNFGHNQANTKLATPIDVVAHEYGHAIFQTTPGGAGSGNENGGLNESTGDIFGALTEYYANNPNDPPDWTVGEEVNLVGQGPIRYMDRPATNGDPDCYSSSIPSTEVHAAAGPQNHWFYLLSQGGTSSCATGTATGLGIQTAGKIFMNGLSRKTSAWNHARARLATVQAAVQLYPNSGRECNAVKDAWRLVSVPVQSGEPACPTATSSPTSSPTASPTVSPTGNPGTNPPNISVTNVKAHLNQFQSIATSNGGNRYSGRAGYTASLVYVEQRLQAAGYTVTRQTCTSCTTGSVNLIAEWRGGDANQILMLGAHLDGVAAGPGINDNGSGSAAILEVALALAQANPTMTKRVKFAWWADEEQGLRGSAFYVNQLPAAERAKIKSYLNFDMVGSRNAGYFVNNIGTAAATNLRAFYTSIGVQTEENVEGANRSDDASFRNAGIATSGVAAGASAVKTSAQAQKWGGTAGAAYDSCYHASCDTISNVADTPLDRASDAIAYAVWKDAVGDTPPPLNSFSLSLNPTSGSVVAGSAISTSVVTATTSGSAQSVALSASGLPAGATASFSPATVTSGGTSTLQVTTSATTPAGIYTVTVLGDGVSVDRTASFTLTVTGGSGGGCNGVPAWSAASSYVPGDVVSHNSRKWTSQWYSTGAEPGAPGSWAVWTDSGAC